MQRLFLLLVVAAVFALCAVTAHADLEIIQSWPVGDDYFPSGICYDPVRNTLWLSEYYAGVLEYTRTGSFIEWHDTSSMSIDEPRGLEFHAATEYTWVVNGAPQLEVVRYDRSFEVVHRFSLSSMSWACGIAFNTSDGHLYICDWLDATITEWTVGGLNLGVWLTPPFQPWAICYLENEGKFLVSDGGDVIYKITSGGLIQETYDVSVLGFRCMTGLSHDPMMGTVFMLNGGDRIVYEVAGFTTYTGVGEPHETQASWSVIKSLYR